MKKRYFASIITALTVLAAMAVPSKRGTSRTVTLEDGTTVKVTLVGDEYMHRWQDAQGNTYVPAATEGLFRLADNTTLAELTARAGIRKAKADSRRRARQNVNKAATIFKGKKKGLVILVEYTDVKFTSSDPQSLFNDIANKENYVSGNYQGSVKDYFIAQSRGTFELDFDVMGPVALSNKMSYYGANDSYGNDMRPEMMVVEGCKAIDSQVNFADYDWDGDGEVDQVYVIYAGYGEADTYNRENTVWPHEWALSGSSITSPLKLDGVTIDTYACSSELNGSGVTAGIGTMCHEFSHCMGLPDMYDTNYDGNFGMGPWDIMDYGSYNDDGYLPSGYSSYERMISGWLTPVELRRGDKLSVTGMKALEENGEAYMLVNSGNDDEYYLVENRQQVGWDAALPASGLLVLHVDYDENIWNYNLVNSTGYDSYSRINNTHQRLTILHADDDDDSKYYSSSTSSYSKVTYTGDPYPYLGNDSITASSVPAATLYTANADGKKYIDVAIRNIKVDADGAASMDFGPNYYGSSPDVPSGEVLFYESFDNCAGTGGNDNMFGGSPSVANSSFLPDNVGWLADKSYGADKCAKFGTSSVTCSATTPEFNIEGAATLTFRAAPWGTDKTGLVLSVTGNAKINPYNLVMSTGVWTDFSVTLTGDGPVKVKFLPGKRLFLDEVKVVSGSTAVQGVSTADVVPVAVYSVSGAVRQAIGNGINIVKYSDGTIRKVMR